MTILQFRIPNRREQVLAELEALAVERISIQNQMLALTNKRQGITARSVELYDELRRMAERNRR